MSIRARLVVAFLWMASLVAVAAAAREQTTQVVPLDSKILSGGDIGFRVESMHGNVPVGTFVIRWNGQWIEPRSAKKPMRIVPLTR